MLQFLKAFEDRIQNATDSEVRQFFRRADFWHKALVVAAALYFVFTVFAAFFGGAWEGTVQ